MCPSLNVCHPSAKKALLNSRSPDQQETVLNECFLPHSLPELCTLVTLQRVLARQAPDSVLGVFRHAHSGGKLLGRQQRQHALFGLRPALRPPGPRTPTVPDSRDARSRTLSASGTPRCWLQSSHCTRARSTARTATTLAK